MDLDDRAMSNAKTYLAARSPRRDLARRDKKKEPMQVNDCIMEFSVESPNSRTDSHAKNMSMLIRVQSNELRERASAAIAGPRASNNPTDKFA